ncbi:aminotransferase class IV [Micromonospora sp. NBC_01740]|uniref:aminotransferase class IV n=1 Tax=Micromonospora sp. NBC_01740 TaxID=2975986 RepID=UPI002E13821D|nr:aminotransferase class IV [Micromonospora sp. NBC_01740]
MTGGEDLSPVGAGRLVWTGARTFVPLPSRACDIDVADSWLVDGGRCRGLELHRQRFAGSCRRHDVAPGIVDAFLEDVIDVLPRGGRWFPRVEYHAGEFRFWLRPAPRLSASVVLWVPGVGDSRTEPSVKGPDLAALEALRDEAGRAGAGEALLLSPQGEVREGALSGLMWWRGDGLCAPPDGRTYCRASPGG